MKNHFPQQELITAFALLIFLAAASGFVLAGENGEENCSIKDGKVAADSEEREIDKLLEQFKGNDAAGTKKAAEQLVRKGEEAIEPLMKLLGAKDRALATRAATTLAKIGVVDGLYVKMALFHNKFLPHEPVGVRFIFRNYGPRNVTVFNPAGIVEDVPGREEPGFGFSLSLLDEKSGKETAKIDMNNALQPAGLKRDNFAVLKPGEVFEEIVTLRSLFKLQDAGIGDYVIKGKYSGKTPHNKAIAGNPQLGADNLFEDEIEARPLSFKVRDVEVPVPDNKKKKQIEKWITELGDYEYKARLAAEKNLEKEGIVTLPFLRKALKEPDVQVRKTAQRLIDKLTEDRGKMVTFLGIQMTPAPDDKSINVLGTFTDSQAEKFGLEAGDTIIKVGETKIPGESFFTQITFLRKQVQCRRKGDIIKLTVKRGDGEKVFEIPLGETLKESLEE